MRYFFALWLAVLLVPPALAEPGYRAVEALMEAPTSLNGRFEQSKYLAALETDIGSSGRFSYQQDIEINWHTLAPIENLLRLTPDQITSEQDGALLTRLETRSNPVVALFSEIFFGVMTARWDRLDEHFRAETHVNGSDWQAILVPREVRVQRVVSRVELQGDHYLRQVVLYEEGGDWTRIRFYDLQQ
ncbi:hypothetical protein CLV44_10140 [Marinobacterium halophilum]|uniref:Outer membrane lipoprotein carrier protein LolA n=1 Tax=Marinobacterium halophilum TaxID=267374 RepID=A0A2P8F4K7_9GAMM|nr:outer membrane lipoprotein carrier protein LolA [Marinobacterium halophilum]PSL16642.1 hypothetical protein CLV44_10140 [Marinobacterium halophilum]